MPPVVVVFPTFLNDYYAWATSIRLYSSGDLLPNAVLLTGFYRYICLLLAVPFDAT